MVLMSKYFSCRLNDGALTIVITVNAQVSNVALLLLGFFYIESQLENLIVLNVYMKCFYTEMNPI